jgi:3-oxoadipate enol-lactonase
MVSATSEVRGASIGWSENGTGPTVVFAHGLSRSRARDANGPVSWMPISETHRLVAYDARGHGVSGGDPVPSEYRWSELGHDLLALLDVIAPGERVSGVGSSMGTATLLHAAVHEPDRFDRLVLALPPTAWATRAGQADLYRARADLVEREGKDKLLELISSMPLPPILAGLESYDRTPDISEALLPSVLRGLADSDLPEPEAIQSLSQPLLLLAWNDDPVHPMSTSQELLTLSPDAQLSVAVDLADVLSWGSRAAEFFVDK